MLGYGETMNQLLVVAVRLLGLRRPRLLLLRSTPVRDRSTEA
jgi:hypothetical protein